MRTWRGEGQWRTRMLAAAAVLALAAPLSAERAWAQNGVVRSETVPDDDEPRNAWPDQPPPPKPAKPPKRRNGYIQPGSDGIVRSDPVVEPGDPGYAGPPVPKPPRPKPAPQPQTPAPVEPPQPQPEPPKPEPPKPEPPKPEPPKPQPQPPEPVPEPQPPIVPPPVVQPPKYVPPKPVLVPEPGDDVPTPPVQPDPQPQPQPPPQPPKPQPPKPQPPKPQPPQPQPEFIPPEAFPEPVAPQPQPPTPQPQPPTPQPQPPTPQPQPPTPQPQPQPVQPTAGLIRTGLSDVRGNEFSYFAPGDLKPGTGTGVRTDTIFAPGMRYPIETAPTFPNSQVYGRGGYLGPGGGLCDSGNYAYPWRDNFCEKRGWQTPACPGGRGHQGQDIRAMDCKNATHWAVAAEDGVITKIGGWSVNLKGASGREYIYLHLRMRDLAVRQGQQVTRGQRMGKVSNDFGGQPTSIHLHFEIRANVALPGQPAGFRKVPPYASLVDAYKRLLRGQP